MNRFSFFFLLIIVITLNSCGSKNKKLETSIHDVSYYQDILKNHNFGFEWYGAKATVRMEDDYEAIGGKLLIRMKYQDSVWIVAKKLGIEGMRFLLTPDSLFIINRHERSYVAKDFSSLKYEFGISLSFEDIQGALSGNIIYDSGIEPINIEFDSVSFIHQQSIKSLLIKHLINLSSLEISESIISDDQDREIKIEYSDYQDIDEKIESAFYRYYLIPETEFGDLHLEIDFSTIELDIPQEMPFSIPDHYEKID